MSTKTGIIIALRHANKRCKWYIYADYKLKENGICALDGSAK